MYSAASKMPSAEIHFHTNATEEMISHMKELRDLSPPQVEEAEFIIGDEPARVEEITAPEYSEYWSQAIVKGIPRLQFVRITKEYSPTPAGKHVG